MSTLSEDSGRRIGDRIFRALEKRKISPKLAARIGGMNPESVRRMASGETRKIDIDFVNRMANFVEDREAFLSEVFGVSVDTGHEPGIEELKNEISRLRRVVDAVRSGEIAAFEPVWCLDDGRLFPAGASFDHSARLAVGLPGEGDAIDYVCRGFGWIAIGYAGPGVGYLRLEKRHVDSHACIAAIKILENAPFSEVRVVGSATAEPVPMSVPEACAMLMRRIRSQRNPPTGWIDAKLQPQDAHEDLRKELEGVLVRNPERVMQEKLKTGWYSLFSVDDGEAFCLDIGKNFRVPTASEIGKRVLDRQNHQHFSAIVDRHVVEAWDAGAPTFSRIGVDFGERKTLYERVAIPFRFEGRAMVMTTSKIIEDNLGRYLDPSKNGVQVGGGK